MLDQSSVTQVHRNLSVFLKKGSDLGLWCIRYDESRGALFCKEVVLLIQNILFPVTQDSNESLTNTFGGGGGGAGVCVLDQV